MEKLYAFLQKKVVKRILVAPLDWGLGHASRCIPIIKYFIAQGNIVHLASSGEAGKFLRLEFPFLPYSELPSYNINYNHPLGLAGGLLWQTPSVLNIIKQENKQLSSIVTENNIDIIVSDHRYGIWHHDTLNILLIHQLGIRSPFMGAVINPILRKVHYSLLKPFRYIWIPDFPGDNNLSGKLSHDLPLPDNSWYIGPLSRFSPYLETEKSDTAGTTLLAILSGPEPQRSQLEEIILKSSFDLPLPVKIIQGKFREHNIPDLSEYRTTIPYLTSYQLFKEIQSSQLIICRSGYSSLMDLYATGKKALLIPTPGQTEQEYLASYHQKKGNFYSRSQSGLKLEQDLNKALSYKGIDFQAAHNLLDRAYKNIIGEF